MVKSFICLVVIILGSSSVFAAGDLTVAGQIITGVPGIKFSADGSVQTTAYPEGSVIGYARTEVTANILCTSAIPVDNTIPQISEGTELLSLSYAAKRANSKLYIQAHATGFGVTLSYFPIALFTSTSINAISASLNSEAHVSGGQRWPSQLYLSKEYVPGTTAPITYTVRGSSPFAMNGDGSTQIFNGASVSSLTITEIAQ